MQSGWPHAAVQVVHEALPAALLEALQTDAEHIAQAPNFWIPRVKRSHSTVEISALIDKRFLRGFDGQVDITALLYCLCAASVGTSSKLPVFFIDPIRSN